MESTLPHEQEIGSGEEELDSDDEPCSITDFGVSILRCSVIEGMNDVQNMELFNLESRTVTAKIEVKNIWSCYFMDICCYKIAFVCEVHDEYEYHVFDLSSCLNLCSIHEYFRCEGCFNSAGTQVLIPSNEGSACINVWDASNGNKIKVISVDADINCVCSSMDDTNVLAGTSNGVIKVFDYEAGTLQRDLCEDDELYFITVRCAPNNSNVCVAATFSTVVVWDFMLGVKRGNIPWKQSFMNPSFTFTNTEHHILCFGCKDSSMFVWDINAQQEVWGFAKGHYGACFNRNNGTIICNLLGESTLLVLDPGTGEVLTGETFEDFAVITPVCAATGNILL